MFFQEHIHENKDESRSSTPPLIDRKAKRYGQFDTDSDFEYIPKKSKQIESDDDNEDQQDDLTNRFGRILSDRSDKKMTPKVKSADCKMKDAKRVKPHKKEMHRKRHEEGDDSDNGNEDDLPDSIDSNDEEFRPSASFKNKTARIKSSGNNHNHNSTKLKERKSDVGAKSKKKAQVKTKAKAGRKSHDHLKQKKKVIGTGRSKKERNDKGRHQEKKELKEEDNFIKQCLGPACVNMAVKGSKYCCEECGLRLARTRILTILPDRIGQWKMHACKADELSQRELDQVRTQQLTAKRELEELDEKQAELEAIIDESKRVRQLNEAELGLDSEANEADVELSLYCVTCGHEVSYKNALRHMERCFNKFESQTSFGSVFKTKTEGVFCDYYNASAKTYCKRLKVLCPEHSKESGRAADDEVCGAPLTANCFEFRGDFCRMLKKKCLKHHCWEKLRRAELDMQRVNLWLKMDELFEQEQKIRFQMANRGGVIGLLLHQTSVF